MASFLFSAFLVPSVILMIAAILFQLLWGLGGGFGGETVLGVDGQFNNPPGVDIWCGKAYRATNSSFNPGGALTAPSPASKTPLLDLRFYPRMNLYLSNEDSGSFIVDAPLSYVTGSSFRNSTFSKGTNGSIPFTTLQVQIASSLSGKVLVPWSNISVNSTGNEVKFSMKQLEARTDLNEYSVNIVAASPDGLQTFYSTSVITILPPRNDTGSVARLDQLTHGLYVSSPSLTNSTWDPIYPYSFYTSWDWISQTITNSTPSSTLRDFRNAGYNVIHPIPPGGSDPFNHTIFEQFLQICDSVGLYVMYDMRHTYTNTTSVAAQLSRLQSHPSLLLYYTADEPDGTGDPLSATSDAYTFIKSLDPYHPVSLVLNCQNFHFAEYTSGADIVLEDVYPLAVNTSFSPVYDTICNSTYGCCGCDNCHANDSAYPAYTVNSFLDIPSRYADFENYQEWLGLTKQATQGKGAKSIWGVPQAFFDAGSFWQRYSSPAEQVVMHVLRVNHGAMGIVAWSYPTEEALEDITGKLARTIAQPEVVRYLVGGKRVVLDVEGGPGYGLVDATAWMVDGEAKALVSVVYSGYAALADDVRLSFPSSSVSAAEGVVWGGGGWSGDGGSLVKSGVAALEVDVLFVSLG